MQKILFCQFHNHLINKPDKTDIADLYYNGIYKYKEQDGYFKQDSFFELPLWIAEITGSLTKEYKTELLIIDNLKTAVNQIETINPDYVCFSVFDVNKGFIKDIINNYKEKTLFILGGYINFKEFKYYKNVKIYNNVKGFIESLGIKYKYNLDYSLFKNYKTIPRLTLSKGCLNKCKFCIVKKTITEINKRDIIKQVRAFKGLKFKLVYLNDKTLGQCNNYKLLPLIYKRVKKYNPKFKGFIIQTTCNMFLKPDYIENLKKCNIFACELGIETYNNHILKDLRKPQNIKIIDKAMNILISLNIKIIPNIIIGLINENRKTYNNTLKFLNRYKKYLYILNIYNLAIYNDSELAENIKIIDNNDLNENKTDKSFYNSKNLKDNKYFYNKIFKLGLNILKRG